MEACCLCTIGHCNRQLRGESKILEAVVPIATCRASCAQIRSRCNIWMQLYVSEMPPHFATHAHSLCRPRTLSNQSFHGKCDKCARMCKVPMMRCKYLSHVRLLLLRCFPFGRLLLLLQIWQLLKGVACNNTASSSVMRNSWCPGSSTRCTVGVFHGGDADPRLASGRWA